MSNLSTFLAYAAAFEQTFDDDDWQRLAPFLTEDATYEVSGIPGACVLQGRDRIFAGMKKSLDGFDRRMTKREIVPTARPVEEGNRVTFQGVARYVRDGAVLDMPATLTAEFEGGRICRMHDKFALDAAALAWFKAHAHGLDGSYL